jgi:AmmeMemoRadiSam system protein A
MPGTSEELTQDEGRWLLRLARRTLERLKPTGYTVPPDADLGLEDIPEICRQDRGVFVTLHNRGNLRGCIGYVQATTPLYRGVIENAVHAARCDPRFSSVTLDEVEELELEISVLTVPAPLNDPKDVEVGRHGLIVSRGGRRGLLLPQVATEYGWDRETFLDHTCIKAGLEPGAWREAGTRIEAFSAQVFME